jgi:excisionase family DNA binding protein
VSRLITPREGAALLAVQPITIYRLIKSKKLRALHPMGSRSIRLREADVLALMQPTREA